MPRDDPVAVGSRLDLPTPGVDVPSASPSEDGAPLELVHRLCDTLVAEGISYCHWKSNEAIDRSARGDSDLDLLVDQENERRFAEIIHSLGFKLGRSPTKDPSPDVFHAYGLDLASGKLVHLHVHHRLIVGDDMTKNYRLPIEQAYLASAEQGPVFRLPAPRFELVAFVLRMVLKHSTWDAIMSGRGALSPSEGRELGYLSSRTDDEGVRFVVREHLPFLGLELWERCRRCLSRGTPLEFRIRTARRLERSLAQDARRSPGLDPFVRMRRRSAVAFRRHVLHQPPVRPRLDGGGALIAFVGGDGAGKTTTVEAVRGWLSKDLDVVTVHLGKPPRSVTSALVNAVWRRGIRDIADRSASVGVSPADLRDEPHIGLRTSLKLIRNVMISRDRYIAYRRGRRSTRKGSIVIADRFPLPQVTLMDGPATAGISHLAERNVLLQALAAFERRYYHRIHDPDILIVLRVDPDVAVQRRTGIESEEFVRRRAEEIWHLDWSDDRAVVIDAGMPNDRMLAEIRSVIWARL